MADFWIGFGFGAVAGGCLGALAMALVVAAGNADAVQRGDWDGRGRECAGDVAVDDNLGRDADGRVDHRGEGLK